MPAGSTDLFSKTELLESRRIDSPGGIGAEDFYEVVSDRYERGAVLLTSNRNYSEWPETFVDNPLLASAALDQLAHRAHLVARPARPTEPTKDPLASRRRSERKEPHPTNGK